MENSKTVVVVDREEPPVEFWDIEDLVPYEKNQKVHTPEDVDKLAVLIKRQGMIDPISVDADGEIIAGHRRRLANLKLGKQKVAVRVWRDISKAEAQAMRISSNKSANEKYDDEMMAESVTELLEAGMQADVAILGFDQAELEGIMSDSESALEAISASFVDLDIQSLLTEQSSTTAQTSASESISEAANDTTSSSAEKKDLSESYEPSFQLQIVCESESQQESLYEEFSQRGLNIKVMSV